jgi:hypothetical protein
MPKKKEKKASRKEVPKKNTVFWICLILFISAWMFVLGVLVGRGTAPVHFDIEKLQKELAALRSAVLEKELKRYKINSPDSPDKPELGYHEALKAPDHDARRGKKTSVRAKAKRRKKTGQGLKKKMPTTAVRPFKSRGVISGSLTIQVASSKELNFADKMVAQLKKKGYPAYRVTTEITGKGTWHRIRIGKFNNRAEAARFLDSLKKKNIKGIIVKQ